MLRSQRNLLILGSLLIAWLLHVNLCDWVVNAPPETRSNIKQSRVLAVATSESVIPWPHDPTQTITRPNFTGIFTQSGIGYVESFTLGVIAPLLLMLFVGYLALGAKHADRKMHGLCGKCGYNLSGQRGDDIRCPECGTKAS